MIPRVIPMFTKLWKANHDTTPAATNRPNGSVARAAIRMPRQSTTPRARMMPDAPTRPSSSPATVNTKSVCCSGMNRPCVWEPWNSPLPVRPPEPMAMRACWVL